MSWESTAQEVSREFGIDYDDAFRLVSFVARSLRGTGQGVRRIQRDAPGAEYDSRGERMPWRTFTERDRDRE